MKSAEVKNIRRDSSNGIIQMVRGNLGILIGFVIMCVALAVITDPFTTTRNIFSVVRQISVNVSLVRGMTMVILIGRIGLSVGSIMAISSCLSIEFITNNRIPSAAAIIPAIAVDTAVGTVNGVIISNTKIPPFIVTLAMMSIGREFARIYTKATIIPVDDDLFVWVGSGRIFGSIPVQVVFVIVVVVITAIILDRAEFGRNVYAVRDNRQATEYSSINAKRITFWVFTLSGLFASCVRVLSATRIFSGRFSVGGSAEMDAISAVVLGGTSVVGGVGRVNGTIIGRLVIDVLNNGMNLLGIDSSQQYIVEGLVILLAVCVDYIKKGKSKS